MPYLRLRGGSLGTHKIVVNVVMGLLYVCDLHI